MTTINKNPIITVALDNYTFYYKSKYIYLTAKTTKGCIENNQIVVNKNAVVQFKFTSDITNFDAAKFFAGSVIILEVDPEFEDITIKGVKSLRFSATQILSYENNLG